MTRLNSLTVSDRVLRALIIINWIYGFLIFALLVASLVAETAVMGALGVHPGPGNNVRIAGLRVIAVIGIAGIPITYVILSRLLAIVRSVKTGEPFIRENAKRMRTIAWSLLAMELLARVVALVAQFASWHKAPIDVGSQFSWTRWLAVLLLFVLANVFDEGARMREDLEGTV